LVARELVKLLIQKLAVNEAWYSESFSTVHGKEAQESVQGVWLGELGELAGLRKADVESIKHFISTRYDRYRVSYGKRTENFPRQCIFFGTTNNRDFLKDPTGNRRFWPIDTVGGIPTKSVFKDLIKNEVDQIWAEAVTLYKQKEPLFLPREIEDIASSVQKEFTEKDDRTGAIERYLNTLVPENWEELNIYDRRSFLQGDITIGERIEA
jgi:putative DNA primase/helicase